MSGRYVMLFENENGEFKLFCCPCCGEIEIIIPEVRTKCMYCETDISKFIDTGYTDRQLTKWKPV